MRNITKTISRLDRLRSYSLLSFICSCTIFSQLFLPSAELHSTAKVKLIQRGPASIIPEVDPIITPAPKKRWVDEAISSDSSGILLEMKGQVKSWKKSNDFNQNWGLHSTGLYHSPNRGTKQNFIRKKFLKYFDKKMSNSLKNAKEGTILRKVAQVEKTLTPKVSVAVNESVKVKLKGHLLEGKVFIDFENPYVECQTKLLANGKVDLRLSKKFEEIKSSANFKYHVNDQRWEAKIESYLLPFIKTGLSTTQAVESEFFKEPVDTRLEFSFGHHF